MRRGYTPASCLALVMGPESSAPPNPPTPVPVPAPQPISPSPLIASIQSLLAALGFEPGTPDGLPGPQTSKAIAAFQAATGEKVDGLPSEALRGKLQKAISESGARRPLAPTEAGKSLQPVGSGTGFYIRPDLLITNHHVIDECKELLLRKGGADVGHARAIAVSKSDDLAALKADKPNSSYLELRVALQPLRNWREEALFLGLKQIFAKESANILIETSFCRFLPSQRTEAASRRSRFRLKQVLERSLPRNREQCWRERAVWLDAGGQP